LLEGFAEFGFRLNLMPTQQMRDALAIDEIKPKPLDFAGLPLPSRSPCALTSLAWSTTAKKMMMLKRCAKLPTARYPAEKTTSCS